MDIRATDQQYNPYRIFTREQWAGLRDDTPMTLEAGEIAKLRSMHDRLDLKEVEEIYLPLSRHQLRHRHLRCGGDGIGRVQSRGGGQIRLGLHLRQRRRRHRIDKRQPDQAAQ